MMFRSKVSVEPVQTKRSTRCRAARSRADSRYQHQSADNSGGSCRILPLSRIGISPHYRRRHRDGRAGNPEQSTIALAKALARWVRPAGTDCGMWRIALMHLALKTYLLATYPERAM